MTQVDERTASREDEHPVFRVHLHGSEDTSTHGWTDTYDVTGADLLQVIDWAQTQAGDLLTYAIALVDACTGREPPNRDNGRELVWLVGIDGNASTDNDPTRRRTQERMLERRRHPVAVPQADKAPADTLHPYDAGRRAHR